MPGTCSAAGRYMLPEIELATELNRQGTKHLQELTKHLILVMVLFEQQRQLSKCLENLKLQPNLLLVTKIKVFSNFKNKHICKKKKKIIKLGNLST